MKRLAVILLGLATLGGLGIVFAVIAVGWRRRTVGPADVIVVLGAKVFPDGRPSRALAERARRAAELFRQGIAPVLMLSGGAGPKGREEATVLRDLVTAQGVPAAACVLERQSLDTAGNARCCSELLRGMGSKRIVLVTDPYHLLRARLHFRRHGIDPQLQASRTDGIPPGELLYWLLREALAVLVLPFRGAEAARNHRSP